MNSRALYRTIVAKLKAAKKSQRGLSRSQSVDSIKHGQLNNMDGDLRCTGENGRDDNNNDNVCSLNATENASLRKPNIDLFLEVLMNQRRNHHLWERRMNISQRKVNGASSFIPADEIVSVEEECDKRTQSMLVDAFLQENRLEHLFQVMAYHPQYLVCFLKTQQYLMQGDGPLPFHHRHYIAIMAAAEHSCSYLVDIHSAEFLLQGGDERWLNGLEFVPPKLQKFSKVSKILAHRPWLISADHIELLTRGSSNWSMSELMQALVILAHFHSLSSFVHGCGINPEIDHTTGQSYFPSYSDCIEDCAESEDSCTRSNGESTPGEDGLFHGSLSHSDDRSAGQVYNSENVVELSQMSVESSGSNSDITAEEMNHRLKRMDIQNEQNCNGNFTSPKSRLFVFVDDPSFVYEEFRKRSPLLGITTFRAHDYSWEDHGYSLADRLYTDIGTLLDEKFHIAQNLTYCTMGDRTGVDTIALRFAIWNYVQCLLGIRHDDCDYNVIIHLLEKHLMSFIKLVTCYPERVVRDDYDRFIQDLKHSEKVHVNLIILEARLQAELLYSLRAITKHMT